jgi:ACS family sodium-dependent inorganic phosphate cotransporter
VTITNAFLAMTELKPLELENGTVVYYRHFDWSSQQQGLILSSFFYGYICTQFIGGIIAAKFGGHIVRSTLTQFTMKLRCHSTGFNTSSSLSLSFSIALQVLGLGIFVTAVLTLLSPLAANAGVGAFVALRVLMGLAEGFTFPCMHQIWSKWAPPLGQQESFLINYQYI